MAITALNSAATGLRALSTRIDVVANNLANAETTAFKGSRVNFEDLMYLQQKQPGTTSGNGEIAPSGIYVGLGTKISNTQIDLDQGSMENTGRALDVGISGNGFFKVKILDTIGDGVGYTRNGNFFINSQSELVLGMGDGYKIQPPIVFPTGATEPSISQDGIIQCIKPGQTAKTNVGQLQISQFVNPQGLSQLGGSIYTATDSSGPAIDSKPGDAGAGTMLQGFLEGSNVDPVKELVTLIKTQRSFELNSQSIQTADQALQTIGNLRRN
ncbi:MAG TPA: flagellar basal-body rod protein FlgG [Tepidisphaeraceae bacterium]|jgi:flagellar basal-body rod protein FlgG|nr:flagellar basal-body rod protein FlgG [Tepidisphaeraceae bacterium]